MLRNTTPSCCARELLTLVVACSKSYQQLHAGNKTRLLAVHYQSQFLSMRKGSGQQRSHWRTWIGHL